MCAQTILITGANGFLGAELVVQLRKERLSIVATGLERVCLHEGVSYRQANILDRSQMLPIVAGTSTIIHTAGLAHIFRPDAVAEQFQLINENGTASMVSVAAEQGVKHFILISSVSVY